jgi:hypothetical protein
MNEEHRVMMLKLLPSGKNLGALLNRCIQDDRLHNSERTELMLNEIVRDGDSRY